MSNCYCDFCVKIAPLTEEQQAYAVALSTGDVESIAPELFALLEDNDCGLDFAVIPRTIGTGEQREFCVFIESEETGNADNALLFVQHLVRRFGLPPVGFEWAHWCDRHRTEAFGGGAAVIHGNTIQRIDTNAWMHARLKDFPQPSEESPV
jgi:hypothetical protein